MIDASVETGVLSDFPPLISQDALQVPRENLLIMATGSQGERRAATAQLANGKYGGFHYKRAISLYFHQKQSPVMKRRF